MQFEPGQIVRVTQLGSAGHKFRHPAYARVHNGGRDGQIGIQFLLIDQRDADEMVNSEYYVLDNTGFSAIPQFLRKPSAGGEAQALALWAFNDEKLFVKPFNEVTEGDDYGVSKPGS